MAFYEPKYLLFLLLLAIVLPRIRSQEVKVCAIALASMGFYLSFFPVYAIFLVMLTLCAYGGALLLDRVYAKLRVPVFCLTLFAILSPLLSFKYVTPFAPASGLFGFLIQIGLPVGLSFYTFQALGYVIDVFIGTVRPERRPIRFAAFMFFFPQLTAGPIARSSLLMQFDKLGKFNYDNVIVGLQMLLTGLFMKLVIADTLSPLVDATYAHPEHFSRRELFATTLGFSIQVYADFAGYSLIAIGSARLLGIELMKNFDHPYFSQTLPEYWRRWHISLSSWFRDYVFTPLHLQCRQWGKFGLGAALVFTFTLVGVWHGASLNLAIFGAVHGMLVAASTLTIKRRDAWLKRLAVPRRLVSVVRTTTTFFIITLSFVLFRTSNLEEAQYIYRVLLVGKNYADSFGYISQASLPFQEIHIGWRRLVGACIVFLLVDFIVKNKWHVKYAPRFARTLSYHLMFIAVYVTWLLRWMDTAKDIHPFIYFKF